MKLQPPHTHLLNAAQGWLELGLPLEAIEELAKIPARYQSHPEVLEVRWQIHAREQQWDACVICADKLVQTAPERAQGWIHRSYALHELKRTREAFDALLPASSRFPRDWLIQYNLACYCCRMKDFQRSLKYLERACKLGNATEIKAMALKDPDLLEVRNLLP